jgi:hypothetical protein
VVLKLVEITNRHGKVRVELVVAPTKSNVLIDGKFNSKRTVYLTPGRHKFEVNFYNFNSYSVEQDVSKNAEVLLSPIPNTAEAQDYLKNNPDEQRAIESIGGKYQNIVDQKAKSSYPFLSSLPIEQRYFSIYHGAPISTKVDKGDYAAALYVSSDSVFGRNNSVESIKKELGIDPTVIEVYFQDTQPIFAERGE